jgi:hypothetical protein
VTELSVQALSKDHTIDRLDFATSNTLSVAASGTGLKQNIVLRGVTVSCCISLAKEFFKW